MEANTFHYYLLRLGKYFYVCFIFIQTKSSMNLKEKKRQRAVTEIHTRLTTGISRGNNEETYETSKIMQEFTSQ